MNDSVTPETPGAFFNQQTGQWELPGGRTIQPIYPPPGYVLAATPITKEIGILKGLCTTVTIFAVLGLVASVIAGFAIGAVTSTSGDVYNPTTTHPLDAVGVGVAFVGIFEMLVVLMLSQWARVYAMSRS